MSRFEASIPSVYFDDLYAGDPDPWQFTQSPYERDKYAATLAALARPRYASALEVGCSIGVLTRELATRCDALLSIDIAEAALAQARGRCADLPQVRFEQRRVPADWPSGRFDLILLSELLYFLDRDDVRRLATRVMGAAEQGADIVLVHWLGETHYPLSGDDASELFIGSAGAERTMRRREPAYRLDTLRA